MGIILCIVPVLVILLIWLSYKSRYGIGDVTIRFQTESGTTIRKGQGGNIGEALCDGFGKLYESLSPNSRIDTIQSRLDVMERDLLQYRDRMYPKDISGCEQYVRLTRELLEKKKADRAVPKSPAGANQAVPRSSPTAGRTVTRAFIAEQRRLMTASLRYDILCRDNFRCQICGATAQDGVKLHVDHIIPVSKGGRTEPDNLRTLCERCNMGKGAKIESSDFPQREKRDQNRVEQKKYPIHMQSSNKALQYLKDAGLEYVDMTGRGGSLYFFEQSAAERLKKEGYKVSYAANGTKNTNKRPAWFISPK